MLRLDDILIAAVKKGASDVHLKAGLVPVIRKHGKLRPLAEKIAQLTNEQIEDMAKAIMDEEQKKIYDIAHEIDLGYGVSGLGRFRINIFRQRGSTRMVIRNIPFNIPTLAELNLPPAIEKLAELERGMVLVTGVTGSGKSSTLASLIDKINQTRNKHIVTIEDPIEFLIRDRKSIVSQRELGVDTRSFSTGLRAALRQDPDVILIGEMRDKETIETAIHAAETGHLVFSTLHTLDAQESINRMLGVFEPHQQAQLRREMAGILRAVVSQRLARRKDKTGFVPAVELCIVNARIREMIEDPSRTKEIRDAIEESRVTLGTQSFDQSLMDLISKDLIAFDEAMRLASNPEDFHLRYSGVAAGQQEWSSTNALRSKNEQDWNNIEAKLQFEDD